MDLERLSDVSYQGALYLLEGTKNLEIVKIFKIKIGTYAVVFKGIL